MHLNIFKKYINFHIYFGAKTEGASINFIENNKNDGINYA